MKKIIYVMIFALVSITNTHAQEIKMVKVFNGYIFEQNDKRLSIKDLITIMESNSNALGFMKKTRSNKIIASIISGAGGGLIGFPIGLAINGRDPNWGVAGIGVGLTLISIHFSLKSIKNAKKAVDLYNDSFSPTSYYKFKPEYNIIGNQNGIGLAIRF